MSAALTILADTFRRLKSSRVVTQHGVLWQRFDIRGLSGRFDFDPGHAWGVFGNPRLAGVEG